MDNSFSSMNSKMVNCGIVIVYHTTCTSILGKKNNNSHTAKFSYCKTLRVLYLIFSMNARKKGVMQTHSHVPSHEDMGKYPELLIIAIHIPSCNTAAL